MEDRANILREMQICRFCLCNDELILTNIYERQRTESKFSVPLPLQIMACSAIEVFKNDGMPQQICNSCRTLTMQAYTFKTNCKKADDALKVFLVTGQLSKPYMQKVEPMQVPRESPKILNHEQFSKPSQNERSHEENSTEIIKVLINNKDGDIQEENHKSQQRDDSGEYEEEDEEMECGEIKNMDTSQFDFEEISHGNSSNSKTSASVKTDCYPCPLCDRAFPLKQLLDLHVSNHNREREYECGECNRKFFSKYDLSKHLLTHTFEKQHSCFVCKKSFTREFLLKKHYENDHKDDHKYECEECGKAFPTQVYLLSHMQNHKKKRRFTCNVCNKSFVFKQGLERHLVVHEEDKPFKCNYCEASFNSAIKLTRHITSHAGLRPYPCKICHRTFLLSHHLTRHMRSHYAVQSSSIEAVIHQHKCDICSMSFRRKDSLINHSAIHSMVNLRCVICNTSFATAQLVKEHITTHLTGLPFPCEKCDYSFDTSEQLEEHELKHVEMEYEEQIEKEVINEALQKGDTYKLPDDIMDQEETDVAEYTIEDFSNQEVSIVPQKQGVPKNPSKQKQGKVVQSHQESTEVSSNREDCTKETESQQRHLQNEVVLKDQDQVHIKNYVPFLKDEVDSDVEEMGIPQEALQQEDTEEVPVDEIEPIKPVIRHEGTKVYRRKAHKTEKKIPDVSQEPIRLSSLEEPAHIQDSNTLRVRDLSPNTLNSLQTKRVVDMKMGNKVVKVQKFIITKEEMKAMAKQGILEIKNGQVVLKNAGHPVLNATLKPVRKTEIESLLEKKSEPKMQLKQYQKKNDRSVGTLIRDNSSFTSNSVTSESIDLDESYIDASQTTIQTD